MAIENEGIFIFEYFNGFRINFLYNFSLKIEGN